MRLLFNYANNDNLPLNIMTLVYSDIYKLGDTEIILKLSNEYHKRQLK